MDLTTNKILHKLLRISVNAGQKILEIYNEKSYSVEQKEDESPLTTADLESNRIINEGLKEFGIPVLSEENREIPYEERKGWKEFFLVDPLDGTKEFVKRNGEFTVNIALVRGGKPIMGVIYAPVLDILYWGLEEEGSYKLENASENNPEDYFSAAIKLQYIKNNSDTIRVVASKSHFSKETEEFVNNLKKDGKEIELVSKGSSLKFCLLAEGKADIYPRLGPTMEWDTGAGHAIAQFSGYKIVRADNDEELIYNKINLLNPWFKVV